MTDYANITQYQQDTITQIWLSLAFLSASAQIAHTEAETHILAQPRAAALSAKGTIGARHWFIREVKGH